MLDGPGRLRCSAAFGACVSCLLGCGGGPVLGRLGDPVALPNGGPRTTCERENWYELVPSRVEGRGVTPTFSRYRSTEVTTVIYEGYGVYRPGESDPIDLEDVWPRLKEPALQKQHMVIIDSVEAATWKSFWWAMGGLAGLTAGVGTAAAIQDETSTGATVAGLTGLALGLTGVVVSLAVFPSAGEQAAAEAREKIFVPDEDDMEAVHRGTDRANAERRRGCGGTPVPYEPRFVAAPDRAPQRDPAPPPAGRVPPAVPERQTPGGPPPVAW